MLPDLVLEEGAASPTLSYCKATEACGLNAKVSNRDGEEELGTRQTFLFLSVPLQLAKGRHLSLPQITQCLQSLVSQEVAS